MFKSQRKHHTISARQRTAGFTMVEMMAALILLVVGAFSVFVLLLIAIQTDLESGHYAAARQFCQQEMAELRMLPVGSLSGTTLPNSSNTVSILAQGTTLSNNNATTLTAPSGLPGGAAKIWILAMQTGSQTTMDYVKVQVTWTEPGRGSDTVTMDTYMAVNGIDTH